MILLLGEADGLDNRYHVESELLKDAMVSERIGLRKHLPVDGLVAKTKVLRLLVMGGRKNCESATISTYYLDYNESQSNKDSSIQGGYISRKIKQKTTISDFRK